MSEACRLGLVNETLSNLGAIDGSSFINGLLYYYLGPILNMKILSSEETEYMAELLSTNNIQTNITEIVDLIKKVSPRCRDYFLKCLWNSKIVNCTEV